MTWSDETFRIFELDGTMTDGNLFCSGFIEHVALVRQTIEHALLNGKNFELEHRLLMPNGSVKHLHVCGKFVSSKDNGGVEFAGAVIDKPNIKRAEDERKNAGPFLT